MTTTKKITDKFSKLKVSRQRKYQLRQIAMGKCPQCSEPGAPYYCKKHMLKARERDRKRNKRKARWFNSRSYKL